VTVLLFVGMETIFWKVGAELVLLTQHRDTAAELERREQTQDRDRSRIFYYQTKTVRVSKVGRKWAEVEGHSSRFDMTTGTGEEDGFDGRMMPQLFSRQLDVDAWHHARVDRLFVARTMTHAVLWRLSPDALGAIAKILEEEGSEREADEVYRCLTQEGTVK